MREEGEKEERKGGTNEWDFERNRDRPCPHDCTAQGQSQGLLATHCQCIFAKVPSNSVQSFAFYF